MTSVIVVAALLGVGAGAGVGAMDGSETGREKMIGRSIDKSESDDIENGGAW